jgi:hypothetical protein
MCIPVMASSSDPAPAHQRGEGLTRYAMPPALRSRRRIALVAAGRLNAPRLPTLGSPSGGVLATPRAPSRAALRLPAANAGSPGRRLCSREPGEGSDHQRLSAGVQGGLDDRSEVRRMVDRNILGDAPGRFGLTVGARSHGVFANAMLGGVIARRERLDPIGFATLAVLSGLGGGMIRDVLLQRGTPVALTDYVYLFTAFGGAALVFAVRVEGRLWDRLWPLIDALAFGCWVVGLRPGAENPRCRPRLGCRPCCWARSLQ